MYDTLSKYLLENGFVRGKINNTLFIKWHKRDFMLVHVYVDDIIFGASNVKMCRDFEKVIKKKFEMSTMGKMTFFLVLQVD